jgi:hypothetical protein
VKAAFIAVLAIIAIACATPAVLVDHTPHPCGEYPVNCGEGRCCPEGNLCFTARDGSHVCELNDGARLQDAGVDPL